MLRRLVILALGLLVCAAPAAAQNKQIALMLVSRVSPRDRTDFEYQILTAMRADLAVTPKGVGDLAAYLADLASKGRVTRAQAETIADNVASLYRRTSKLQATTFPKLLNTTSEIIASSQASRLESRKLLEKLEALK